MKILSDKKKNFYKTFNNIVNDNRINDEETYIMHDYISEIEMDYSEELDENCKLSELLLKEKEKNNNLNNIINELEKYLNWVIEYTLNNDEKGTCKSILDKLKELKEGK